MDINESKLIAKVMLNNSHHAFASLVQQHQSQIRNYARRLSSGDLALADDISQDTFITAFEKINNYDATGSFIGWLLKICYRHFLQHLRKNKLEYIDSVIEIEITDNTEPQILIEKALSYVTYEERSAITLHSTFGYTHQEISNIMQLPLGTVKSHIVRGKQKITELLLDNGRKKQMVQHENKKGVA